MTQSRRVITVIAAAALGSVACSDVGPSRPSELGSFVSEPTSPAWALRMPALVGAGTVYVSLPAGSYPTGERAVVVHRASRWERVEQMVDGGLDPLAVGAAVGDTLELRVKDAAGTTIATLVATVPARRPPRVVRTIPPRGKKDVPLNAMIIVVFSEPVDSATISASSVGLNSSGGRVSGALQVDADGLRVRFTQAEPLAANTDYTIEVTTGIADLSGEHAIENIRSDFQTGTTTLSLVQLWILQPAVTIAPTEQIRLTALGSDSSREPLDVPSANWASANPSIARVTSDGLLTGTSVGTTTVRVSVGVLSAEIPVTVTSLEFTALQRR